MINLTVYKVDIFYKVEAESIIDAFIKDIPKLTREVATNFVLMLCAALGLPYDSEIGSLLGYADNLEKYHEQKEMLVSIWFPVNLCEYAVYNNSIFDKHFMYTLNTDEEIEQSTYLAKYINETATHIKAYIKENKLVMKATEHEIDS